METPNYRKASIYFDDETVLEVEQRGGGGSGVGGDTGLAAVNLITGESTNEALAEKDETITEQAATIEEQAGTIETQAATIEEQAGEISDLEDEVAAKQAIIDAFPTIEALNVTANGTYSESGKAYSPVTVNVPSSVVGARAIQCKFTNAPTHNVGVASVGIASASETDRIVSQYAMIYTENVAYIATLTDNPNGASKGGFRMYMTAAPSSVTVSNNRADISNISVELRDNAPNQNAFPGIAKIYQVTWDCDITKADSGIVQFNISY